MMNCKPDFLKNWLVSLLLIFLCDATFGQTIIEGTNVFVQSPDKNISIRVYQKEDRNKKRTLYYTVSYKSAAIINESVLELQLDNHLSESAMALKIDKHERWMENLKVKRIITSSKDTSWMPVVGEKKIIPDKYNGAVIEMVKDDNTIYNVNVELRAYNEGAAVRFFFPERQTAAAGWFRCCSCRVL